MVFGDDHSYTLISLSNLASVLRDLGELDESAELAAEAVRRAKALWPQGHANTAAFLLQHGRTLAAMHHFEEARAVLLEAQGLFESTVGAEHVRTIATREALSELYDSWQAADAGE